MGENFWGKNYPQRGMKGDKDRQLKLFVIKEAMKCANYFKGREKKVCNYT
jgi:hypothetical protein